jgi:hypothetical protein
MSWLRGSRLAPALLGAALAASAAQGGVPASATAEPLHVPAAERRTPDQTWLTFPEWFLVFSPNDYAETLAANQPASSFPFFRHVREFWSAYHRVAGAIAGKYPFNGEYHTMIVVIGVSTTVEYGLKGSYETLVGRLTELTSAPNATPEDRLATQVARDYVEFVRVRPWYEFDFNTPLKRLWRDTPAFGGGLLRKWERRYMLTTEWAIKSVYAAALMKATRASFDIPKTTTFVVVDGYPSEPAPLKDVRLQSRAGTQALLALPRYQAFTDASIALAKQGAAFREIAGNEGLILVSLVVPASREDEAGVKLMLRQEVVSQPGYQRRVLEVPVPRLSELLARHAAAGDRIEHVFDY